MESDFDPWARAEAAMREAVRAAGPAQAWRELARGRRDRAPLNRASGLSSLSKKSPSRTAWSSSTCSRKRGTKVGNARLAFRDSLSAHFEMNEFTVLATAVDLVRPPN